MAVLRWACASAMLIALGACTDLLSGSDVASDFDASTEDGAAEDASDDGTMLNCTPALTSVDYPVIAHGARLVLSGTCLSGTTEATVAGVTHTPTAVSNTSVTLTLEPTAPLGMGDASIVSPRGASNALSVHVIHLTVEELDADSQNGNDKNQFVEVGTARASAVDLSGYALVLIDGGTDETYPNISSVALQTSGANGLLLLGNPAIANRQQTFPNNTIGQGSNADAVALVQTRTPVPGGTAIGSITAPVLDALVFARGNPVNDDALLAWAFPEVAERVQWNEDASGAPNDNAIRRCGNKPLAGTRYGFAAPSPGVANSCP